MTKDERAKLLRERLNAVRGYSLPPLPKIAKPKKDTQPKFFRNFIHLAVGQHVREIPKQWVSHEDAASAEAFHERRTARKSYLTRLMELYPQRLPRHDISSNGR